MKATKQSKESESICYLKPVTGMTVEYDPIKNVMVVKWAKTSDATEYSVHRSLNGGNGVWYKTVSGLSLEDADISVKQTYGYAAKAQRGNDRGARSAFVTYGYAGSGIDNAAAPAATPEPPPASVESPAAAADAPAVDSPPPEETYDPSGA